MQLIPPLITVTANGRKITDKCYPWLNATSVGGLQHLRVHYPVFSVFTAQISNLHHPCCKYGQSDICASISAKSQTQIV